MVALILSFTICFAINCVGTSIFSYLFRTIGPGEDSTLRFTYNVACIILFPTSFYMTMKFAYLI